MLRGAGKTSGVIRREWGQARGLGRTKSELGDRKASRGAHPEGVFSRLVNFWAFGISQHATCCQQIVFFLSSLFSSPSPFTATTAGFPATPPPPHNSLPTSRNGSPPLATPSPPLITPSPPAQLPPASRNSIPASHHPIPACSTPSHLSQLPPTSRNSLPASLNSLPPLATPSHLSQLPPCLSQLPPASLNSLPACSTPSHLSQFLLVSQTPSFNTRFRGTGVETWSLEFVYSSSISMHTNNFIFLLIAHSQWGVFWGGGKLMSPEGDHADPGASSWNASNRWCLQPSFFLDLTAWVITQIRGCQVGTHPTAGAPSPIFLSLGELDWRGGALALTPICWDWRGGAFSLDPIPGLYDHFFSFSDHSSGVANFCLHHFHTRYVPWIPVLFTNHLFCVDRFSSVFWP